MKLNLNSAISGHSSYKMSPITLTTLDFGRVQPVQVLECIPGTHYSKVTAHGLLRCEPTSFPTFGRCNIKNATFFVPEEQLICWSSAFHDGQKTYKGMRTDLPWVGSAYLNRGFIRTPNSLCIKVATAPTSIPSRDTYDFAFPSQTRTGTGLDFYKLTNRGWKLYAIFKALGYDFKCFNPMLANETYAQHRNRDVIRLNAMPLLAYLKIWSDVFQNSNFSGLSWLDEFLQSVYNGKSVDSSIAASELIFDSATGRVGYPTVDEFFANLFVPFESNMYTNAWNDINTPLGIASNYKSVRNNGADGEYQSVVSPYGRTEGGEIGTVGSDLKGNFHSSNSGVFTALGHNTLMAFDKWVRRKNLIGNKAVQHIYAQFGIKTDEFDRVTVSKLSEGSSRVNFSAVVSNSDTKTSTSGKDLGAYAGFGLGGYDVQFSYRARSYGYIITLTWLNIDPILMRGVTPAVLRSSFMDFYQPEFDGKAFRPIPKCELTSGEAFYNSASNNTDRTIFGFTNMYDDYRNLRDIVCGRFLDKTAKTFAFMRDLNVQRWQAASGGLNVFKPQEDGIQYFDPSVHDTTHSFLTEWDLGDRFYFVVDWDIDVTHPIKSNEDSFDLTGSGGLQLTKNGQSLR